MITENDVSLKAAAPLPGPAETETRWYCLRVRPKREHIVAEMAAARTGHEVYAPRVAVRRPCRGSTVTVPEALFPGYFFARFPLTHAGRFVASTPGVQGLLRLGGTVPAIADQTIAFLQAATEGRCPGSAPVLAVGDWVEILSGSFAGCEGCLQHLESGKARAVVLLALLGREVPVTVPAAALRKAGPAFLDFPPALLAHPA